MFQSLSDRLGKTIKNWIGQGRITEENIQDSLREIRIALLEADVALPVVKQFIENVKNKAIGQEVLKSLKPGQLLVKIVQDELEYTLGEKNEGLNLAATPPAVILMAGLQGSGKTTTTAKLAKFLKDKLKKKVLMVSCDVYRPAAIDQLMTLAKEIDVECFPSQASEKPEHIVDKALDYAKKNWFDVLLVDTAGRLHIDDAMMAEIKTLHQHVKPVETLFVVDSMTGQDAANTAKAFHETLPLTGIILTKADGDARGGAALSIRYITGKPIKFLGIGEKTDALEPFYPDRLASRILGMGDVVSLVEEVQEKIDKAGAEKLAKKIAKGKGFDLEDFRDQIAQMNKLGGIAGIMGKLPGMNMIPANVKDKVNDKIFIQITAIINSMTPKERRNPDIIKGSRKKRIAAGSGTQVQDVNRLLKQYEDMQAMMKKFSKGGGMMNLLRGLGGAMGGGFPGGNPFGG
ncbi:MAG: ffh [Gammaproteobacteria bacterium]|jgi:signal recognition particle subunit SRP54|nr:ffh [Gammaproteobacteria bacterium]